MPSFGVVRRPPMRLTWGAKRCWFLVLLLTTGCWTTNWTAKRDFKPPPQPEDYVLPPVTANRFSDPPDFPRQAERDRYARNKLNEPTPPGMGPGNSRFGSSTAMRGP